MAISQVIQNTISLYEGIKVAGSVLTNPADTTVIIDTGQLEKGNYLLGFIIETSAAGAAVDIQHRNAANSANIDFVRIRIPNVGTEYPLFPSKIKIDTNERIRLTMSGGITGEIQANIFYIRVY
jgi:hypothetical protein